MEAFDFDSVIGPIFFCQLFQSSQKFSLKLEDLTKRARVSEETEEFRNRQQGQRQVSIALNSQIAWANAYNLTGTTVKILRDVKAFSVSAQSLLSPVSTLGFHCPELFAPVAKIGGVNAKFAQILRPTDVGGPPQFVWVRDTVYMWKRQENVLSSQLRSNAGLDSIQTVQSPTYQLMARTTPRHAAILPGAEGGTILKT